jgi:hypothetical protein
MPGKRSAIALLLVAFLIGIVAGGTLLSGKDGSGGTSVAVAGPEEEAAAPKPTPTPKPKVSSGLTAQAVHEGNGRIVISGEQRPAKAGTRVTVQRRESSGWVDFPAGSTVGSDGSYSLWLQTGRKGDMSFRVIDSESGETSNPVRIKV